MLEFKKPPMHISSCNEDRVVWIGSIVALAIGLAILLFIVYGPQQIVPRIFPVLVFVFIAVPVSVLILDFLMLRRKIEKRFSQVTLLLSEDRIILRRPGYLDIAVALSEIRSLSEEPGFLVVTGGDPPRRIAVPRSVDNFELIKAELTRHADLSSQVHFGFGYLSLASAAVCCWLVIFSSDAGVIKIAAAVGSVFLLWSSVRMHRALRNKRIVLGLMLAVSWVAWLFLICLHLGNGNSR